MGIRLQCPQGHKVHVKSFLAGQRGICPQCGMKFDIPADPQAAADDGGDEIDVEADMGDRAEGSARRADISQRATAGDPATLDLDALAAAGGTSLLGGQGFGPAAQRIADRQKSARKMRMFTLVLTVAVTLLACVLLYIVFRR